MKRILLLLLLITIFNARGEESSELYYSIAKVPKGEGSIDSPLEISSLEELVWIAKMVNGGESLTGVYFIQTKDIDLSPLKGYNENMGWIPIGGYIKTSVGSEKRGFSGIYDGNNHSIKGLYIDRKEYTYQGLFGYLYEGVVKNLLVEGAAVRALENMGILVAYMYEATIDNCHVRASFLQGDDFYIGGLVGYEASGKIVNSSAEVEIQDRDYVGGLVGWAEGLLEKCHTAGNIQCSLDENIDTRYIGGLVGYLKRGTVSKCGSTSEVTGGSRVGGLIGLASQAIISESFAANKSVKGGLYIGGLIGINEETPISDCYAHSAVYGDEHVGGLAGYISYSASVIKRCYSAGKVTVQNPSLSGGFAGAMSGGSMEYAYWCSDIQGVDKAVGGFNSSEENCNNLTLEQMKTKESFETWDFSSVWRISEEKNNGFPYLSKTIISNTNEPSQPLKTVHMHFRSTLLCIESVEPLVHIEVYGINGQMINAMSLDYVDKTAMSMPENLQQVIVRLTFDDRRVQGYLLLRTD